MTRRVEVADERVVLALGSNLGDRLGHLARGVAGLREGVVVEAVSSVYASEPVGWPDQPEYLNLVVVGRSRLAPRDLLALAHRVEAAEGRRRSFPNAPRTLDVDLVFYGVRRIDEPALTVPHPRWRERAFVTEPLCEVAPDLPDPESGRPVGELASPEGAALRRVAPPAALRVAAR